MNELSSITNGDLVEELCRRVRRNLIKATEVGPIARLVVSGGEQAIARMEALLEEDNRRQIKQSLERANAENQGEFYTREEAAKLLKYHPSTLGRKAAKGEVPSHMFGKTRRYRRDDILGLCIQRHRTRGNDPAPDGQR